MKTLKIENLNKSFNGKVLYSDLNLELEFGKVISIIGNSGCGKTTLLKILNQLEQAESGNIFIDDKLVVEGNVKSPKCLQIGMVFQQFNLFKQYTALQNLTMTLKNYYKNYKKNLIDLQKDDKSNIINIVNDKKMLEEYAISILKKVGIDHKKDNYPHQLSGGEAQRVAIARTLALNPDIICFDEPTSALDPVLTKDIGKLILSLKEDSKLVILVTHDMDISKKVSDELIFMSSGQIIERNSNDDFFNNIQSDLLKEFLSSN